MQQGARLCRSAGTHRGLPVAGDDQDAGKTGEDGENAHKADLLLQHGDGEQHQDERPDIIQRAGLLGGKDVVSPEQDDVVKKRIEQPQQG